MRVDTSTIKLISKAMPDTVLIILVHGQSAPCILQIVLSWLNIQTNDLTGKLIFLNAPVYGISIWHTIYLSLYLSILSASHNDIESTGGEAST